MRVLNPARASFAMFAVLGGCIASNVVAVDDRLVVRPIAALEFAPATELPLDGLYESVEITGDAAVALHRLWYCFGSDGSYTGAALADVDGRPAFQTLNGTWTNGPGGLSLDGAAPVLVERAPDHLRITAPNGVVVLRRVVLP